MAALCNAQHEKFARAIVAGRNATQAYRDAGYQPCRQNASRLMTHDDIQRRITELKEQREIDSQKDHDPTSGRFITGNNGGGRPKGSRNKLAEAFIADLASQWETSGRKALARVAESDPVQFTKIVASVLPSRIDAQLNIDIGLFAEVRDFREAFKLARQHIGAEIEGELVEDSNMVEMVEDVDIGGVHGGGHAIRPPANRDGGH
jgi:hypothetical protein